MNGWGRYGFGLPQDLSRVVARERAEAKPLRVSLCAKLLRVIDTAY
jgi:hypothetical protein